MIRASEPHRVEDRIRDGSSHSRADLLGRLRARVAKIEGEVGEPLLTSAEVAQASFGEVVGCADGGAPYYAPGFAESFAWSIRSSGGFMGDIVVRTRLGTAALLMEWDEATAFRHGGQTVRLDQKRLGQVLDPHAWTSRNPRSTSAVRPHDPPLEYRRVRMRRRRALLEAQLRERILTADELPDLPLNGTIVGPAVRGTAGFDVSRDRAMEWDVYESGRLMSDLVLARPDGLVAILMDPEECEAVLRCGSACYRIESYRRSDLL